MEMGSGYGVGGPAADPEARDRDPRYSPAAPSATETRQDETEPEEGEIGDEVPEKDGFRPDSGHSRRLPQRGDPPRGMGGSRGGGFQGPIRGAGRGRGRGGDMYRPGADAGRRQGDSAQGPLPPTRLRGLDSLPKKPQINQDYNRGAGNQRGGGRGSGNVAGPPLQTTPSPPVSAPASAPLEHGGKPPKFKVTGANTLPMQRRTFGPPKEEMTPMEEDRAKESAEGSVKDEETKDALPEREWTPPPERPPPRDTMVARDRPPDVRPMDVRVPDRVPDRVSDRVPDRAPETRSLDIRPLDRLVDSRPPLDTRPMDTRPMDTRPMDTRLSDARPLDTRPLDTRPLDTRPLDVRPSDIRQPDISPPDSRERPRDPEAHDYADYYAARDTQGRRDTTDYHKRYVFYYDFYVSQRAANPASVAGDSRSRDFENRSASASRERPRNRSRSRSRDRVAPYRDKEVDYRGAYPVSRPVDYAGGPDRPPGAYGQRPPAGFGPRDAAFDRDRRPYDYGYPPNGPPRTAFPAYEQRDRDREREWDRRPHDAYPRDAVPVRRNSRDVVMTEAEPLERTPVKEGWRPTTAPDYYGRHTASNASVPNEPPRAPARGFVPISEPVQQAYGGSSRPLPPGFTPIAGTPDRQAGTAIPTHAMRTGTPHLGTPKMEQGREPVTPKPASGSIPYANQNLAMRPATPQTPNLYPAPQQRTDGPATVPSPAQSKSRPPPCRLPPPPRDLQPSAIERQVKEIYEPAWAAREDNEVSNASCSVPRWPQIKLAYLDRATKHPAPKAACTGIAGRGKGSSRKVRTGAGRLRGGKVRTDA